MTFIGLAIKHSGLLGSKLGGLPHGNLFVSHELTVTRAGKAGVGMEQGDTERGYAFRAFPRPEALGRGIETFMLAMHPRGTDAKPRAHEGQELLSFLLGRSGLFHDERRPWLTPGGSTDLDASRPRLLRGFGDAPSRMLAVLREWGSVRRKADVAAGSISSAG